MGAERIHTQGDSNARSPATCKTYHRIWRIFFSWCQSQGLSWTNCNSPEILQFLQSGFELDLSVTSLKVQTSALAALFQKQWAILPEFRLYFQGLNRLKPPVRHPVPPWDLNVVLQALEESPFEPLDSVDLKHVTVKTVFLFAIASARRVSEIASLSCRSPWLKFHSDKAVLRTKPNFLPKVVTTFHLNQDIVIPVLQSQDSDNPSSSISKLDPVRALKIYVDRTQSLRHSDALFVLFGGRKAGCPASKRTIARWIVDSISTAYSKAGRTPPLPIKAHSTRKVSTSWAYHQNMTLESICNAATWASPHTFSKFYKFDVFHSQHSEFGRKVLQAAVARS